MSTLVVAVVATAGDWIWATFLSRHLIAAGLVHGALLCLAMGAMAARPAGRAAFGAAAGLGIGLGSAALFYALAPILRTGAMFVAWFALWMLLAMVSGARRMPVRHRVGRGVAAGCASGLAFYAVSGMWTGWNPAAVDYAEHFGRWLVAFAPGFLALQTGTPARARAAATRSDII